MKFIKRISVFLIAVMLLLTVGVSSASAHSSFLFDSFWSLSKVSPDEGGKWWVLNTGMYDGWYYVYNDFCGDGTCVLHKSKLGNRYASLEVYPSAVADNYYNAELAELHTGYVYEQPTKWNPEVGKPVTLQSRVRWSENYKIDGSGGAVGSSGIWLWNSSIDYVTGVMHPMDGIGFNWTMEGTAFFPGLTEGVIYQSGPLYQNPVSVNMQRWNVFKSVWGVYEDGTQYVDSYVNGKLLSHDVLPAALHDLSVEIWNDNQRVNSDWTVTFLQPTSTQAFQVDWVKVTK